MPELEEGRDYIIDTNGLLVLTAAYLFRRGYCCGNGCRNCPMTRYQENLSVLTGCNLDTRALGMSRNNKLTARVAMLSKMMLP